MEGGSRSTYRVLRSYVVRSFSVSLLVAFLFFFFIFFINQLLLFAQRILLKHVDVMSVVKLVALSIPQILLYTIPFSTLSASSMVIGDFAERNEVLALRSCGIPLRRLFEPIAIAALLLAVCTFLVADILLPYSNLRFRTIYAQLMRDLPTLEIESYAVNHIGDIVLVTGAVEDQLIHSLVLFDTASDADNQVISAKTGRVSLLDINTFLYRLDLEDVVALSTDDRALDGFSLAQARRMTYHLDFSSQVARFTDVTPSQLSTRDLLAAIEIRKEDLRREQDSREASILSLRRQIADLMRAIETGQVELDQQIERKIVSLGQDLEQLEAQRSVNFYLQYYRAELHKKIALSFSCFLLVLLTFPLGFLRLKHGRLFGFGLSLVVASSYWFLLFFAQTRILDVDVNPGFLIWGPNMVVAIVSAVLLLRSRRV